MVDFRRTHLSLYPDKIIPLERLALKLSYQFETIQGCKVVGCWQKSMAPESMTIYPVSFLKTFEMTFAFKIIFYLPTLGGWKFENRVLQLS